MAKRLSDTGLWERAWFRKLSPRMKCAWQFLISRCDHAGIWQMDLDSMEFHVGEAVSMSDLVTHLGDKIQLLDDDKLLVSSFIEFQYGVRDASELNSGNKVHASVLRLLEKVAPCKPLGSPLHGAKDMEKEKDKEKKKEKQNFDFSEIYAKYPRKQGKTAGLKACRKQILSDEQFAKLSLAVDRFNKHHKAQGTDKKYIPLFSTFMSSWEDCLDADYGAVTLPGDGPTAADVARREAERARKDAEINATVSECPPELRGMLAKFKIPGVGA